LTLVNITRKGNIAIVRLNRPQKLNALNSKLLSELKREIFLLNHDKKIKNIILYGEGKAFSSGADITEMSEFSFKEAYEFSRLGQEVTWLLEMSNKRTIAAMHGYALGGGLDISLACDLRICAKDTKLGYPQKKHGIIPAFGGTQRLQQIIGPHDAKKMIEQGTIITASDAQKIGLIDVLTKQDPLKEAIILVGEIKTDKEFKILSRSKNSNRKTESLPRNLIHERSVFAHRFELQKTRLLLRKFVEERRIRKMHHNINITKPHKNNKTNTTQKKKNRE
jgi:enoyl-CoA hydratase